MGNGSGAHMTIFPAVAKLMKQKGLKNTLLTGGGIIPQEDIPKLKKAGVSKLFGPGAPTTGIIEYIKTTIAKRRKL